MINRDTIRLPFSSPLLSAWRRRARDQRGSALVEVALTTIPLFMLFFGAIEISMAMYNFHYLANAAHEAARYAIVRGSSWGTSCDGTGSAGAGYESSQCTASTSDVANYIANRGFPGINIDPVNDVCVEYYSSVPSSTSTSCTASTGTLSNSPGDIVEVKITVPYQLTIPGLPIYTWHLQSTSEMVIAQ